MKIEINYFFIVKNAAKGPLKWEIDKKDKQEKILKVFNYSNIIYGLYLKFIDNYDFLDFAKTDKDIFIK